MVYKTFSLFPSSIRVYFYVSSTYQKSLFKQDGAYKSIPNCSKSSIVDILFGFILFILAELDTTLTSCFQGDIGVSICQEPSDMFVHVTALMCKMLHK